VLVWLLLSGGAVLALDQLSKRFVLGLVDGRSGAAGLPWPRLRLVLNARSGFGLARSRFGFVCLWFVASAGTILLASRIPGFQNHAARVGLGAALGGATGNLLDVLRRGAVVDFIDLRIWPVFNVADTAIVVGITATLLTVWY
jgi:signal peptidase II